MELIMSYGSESSEDDEWICASHSRRYTSREKFEEHIAGSEHKKNGKPHCPKCELIFSTEFELLCHVSSNHNERFGEPLTCPFHNGYFRNFKDFEEHVASIDHKRDGKPYCPKCRCPFDTELELRDHILRWRDYDCFSEEGWRSTCFLCMKGFESTTDLLSHINFPNPKYWLPHRAYACWFIAMYLKKYGAEVPRASPELNHFRCSVCVPPRSFGTTQGFIQHCLFTKPNVVHKTVAYWVAVQRLRDTIKPDLEPVSCAVCKLKCEGALEAYFHALQFIGDAAHKEHALELARSRNWDERPRETQGPFA